MEGNSNVANREAAARNGTADNERSPAEGNGQTIDIEDVPQRIREIALLRGLGFTFREIGENFGVSPQAVSLMLARHHRAVKSLKKTSDLRCLSARAINVLGRHAVKTRSDARTKNLLAILPNERNCGKKTREEIERWLEAETA